MPLLKNPWRTRAVMSSCHPYFREKFLLQSHGQWVAGLGPGPLLTTVLPLCTQIPFVPDQDIFCSVACYITPYGQQMPLGQGSCFALL